MLVTEEAFPHGVRCAGCGRVIENGSAYKNRDAVTAVLSAGPCTEDRTDAVFCASC